MNFSFPGGDSFGIYWAWLFSSESPSWRRLVCRGKGRFSAGHRDRLEITAKRDTDLTLWFSTWEFGGQRGREIIYGEENKTNNFQSVEYFLHYIVCSSDGICLKIDFFLVLWSLWACACTWVLLDTCTHKISYFFHSGMFVLIPSDRDL